MRRCGLVVALGLAVGCAAPRPVLYPNERYERVGREVAEVEIEECIVLAQDAGASSDRERAGEIAKDTAESAGAGAAAGAVGGAIRGGKAGIGAAIGAATAATWSFVRGGLRWLFGHSDRGDRLERRFVERCLADRGYEVVGWK